MARARAYILTRIVLCFLLCKGLLHNIILNNFLLAVAAATTSLVSISVEVLINWLISELFPG